ncbi:hypothetical protein CCH79_00020193 [Gambusia affinis]|uniref:Uncharacterized protein n=1 Tax=Gambusia affinis TaxID=33528 RepID=A0A315VGP9_GAMAF|nr:hypothetical protein CCH79_00020193 [Gambusia affinis]
MWLSREEVKARLPQRFLKLSPNVRIILGRTHVSLEAVLSERLCGSRWRCALTGLLGAAGLHLSAASLTETSPRSADWSRPPSRGTERLHVGAKLSVPPCRHPDQFGQSGETRAVARLQTVVERAMARVPHLYAILLCSGKFPK